LDQEKYKFLKFLDVLSWLIPAPNTCIN